MNARNFLKYVFTAIIFTGPLFLANAQSLQEIRADIGDIKTPEQADDYMISHLGVKGTVLYLDDRRDTTEIDLILLASSIGDVNEFELDDDKTVLVYKTLEKKNIQLFRVQYIFLDNKKMSITEIDSLRSVILKRVAAGESFSHLASEYSMDGNSKYGGDLGWFNQGRMHKQFEDAVRAKKTGDVFTVDIPANRWYYVVRNSHAPRITEQVTVLYIEAEKGL